MRDDIKTLLQNLMLFLLAIAGLAAITYGWTKPPNPPAAKAVPGGTIMERDLCVWFVPSNGTEVILMRGSKDYCHGRDVTP